MKLVGSGITLTGYGQLEGQQVSGIIQRFDGANRIVVSLERHGEPFEVTFRIADGCIPGGDIKGGLRISADDLARINRRNEAMEKTNAAGAKEGRKKPATPPKAPAVAEVTVKPGEKKTEKLNETAAPAADPRGLSPMERAETERRTVGPEELSIELTPLLAEQVAWDEIEPYPNGRRVPGFKEFKAALASAVRRNYVFVVFNKLAAEYFLNTVLVNGFKGKWKGKNTAPFKRVSVRIAAQISEKFGSDVPEIIATHEAAGNYKPTGNPPGRPPKAAAKTAEKPVPPAVAAAREKNKAKAAQAAETTAPAAPKKRKKLKAAA